MIRCPSPICLPIKYDLGLHPTCYCHLHGLRFLVVVLPCVIGVGCVQVGFKRGAMPTAMVADELACRGPGR